MLRACEGKSKWTRPRARGAVRSAGKNPLGLVQQVPHHGTFLEPRRRLLMHGILARWTRSLKCVLGPLKPDCWLTRPLHQDLDISGASSVETPVKANAGGPGCNPGWAAG